MRPTLWTLCAVATLSFAGCGSSSTTTGAIPGGPTSSTGAPTTAPNTSASTAPATNASPKATASPTAAPPAMASAPAGSYLGTTSAGVTVFKGIPYAQPPIGSLRFEPPQPIAAATGVTQATAFKPACYQKPEADEVIAGPQNEADESEDCLYLNVYAPTPLTGKRPVDVWIYGGAYAAGYGDPYDGTPYAQNGIVFVTFDYRLGIFGFFAHPGLDAISPHHTSGDQGMLDQVAALQWVQKNISAFGGDPNNVTIHGESAGAGSVMSLLASPLGSGLFEHAIAESPFLGFTPAFTTATLEQYYSANFALDGESIASLQALPAESLNAAQPNMIFDNSTSTPYQPDQYSPSIDGYYLPSSVASRFASGAFNKADLLAGNCDDEGLLFTEEGYAPYQTTATFPEYASMTYGSSAAAAEAQYPVASTSDAIEQLGRLYADPIFDYPSRAMVRYESGAGKQAWLYVFTRPQPGQTYAEDTHICEIPFIFKGLYPPTNEQVEPDPGAAAYSAMMVTAWSNFMKTGNPNGGGLATWPAYDATNENYLEFAASGGVAGSHYRKAQLDFVGSYLSTLSQ